MFGFNERNFTEITLRQPLILPNFIQCGQNTLEAYEMLKPYIEYVHVKDARLSDGEVVPAGTGDGQLLDIFEKLDASVTRDI